MNALLERLDEKRRYLAVSYFTEKRFASPAANACSA